MISTFRPICHGEARWILSLFRHPTPPTLILVSSAGHPFWFLYVYSTDSNSLFDYYPSMLYNVSADENSLMDVWGDEGVKDLRFLDGVGRLGHSLGARGHSPFGYMMSSLWVLKQFAHPIPTGYMPSIFEKNPSICSHFTHWVQGEYFWKVLPMCPSRTWATCWEFFQKYSSM